MTALLKAANNFSRTKPEQVQERSKLGLELMVEFTDHLGDTDAMAELQSRFPGIAEMISEIPKSVRVEALRAKTEGEALDGYEPHIAKFINRYDEANSGTRNDLGFTLRHRRMGQQLVQDHNWPLMQDVRVGRTQQTRFAMPNDAWFDVFPGWQGWSVDDDVADRMKLLGVPSSRRDVRSQRLHGTKSCHVPAEDGVLFLDDLCLRDKASRMLQDSDRAFVREVRIDGKARKMFTLPAELFLKMRGVSYKISSTDAHTIADRCRERIKSRGMDEPELHVQSFGSEEHICMPPDEALTLLAPSHPGDAASKLSLRKFDYDPASYDYDPELGVLLVQASSLAYEDKETIEAHASAWGFSEVETIAETAGNIDAQAFAAFDPERNTLLVSFRGSDSREDIRADIDITAVNGDDYGGGEIQEGFEVQLRALLPKLKARLEKHPGARVMVAGHSLGGAMAALFLGWCMTRDVHVDQTYTCGQPPVGNKKWKANVEKMVADRNSTQRPANLFRYVFGSDPVPHAPTFSHAGTLLYIDNDGKLQDPGNFTMDDSIISLLGRLWDSAENSFLHHRCPSYLGIVRKNRATKVTTK